MKSAAMQKKKKEYNGTIMENISTCPLQKTREVTVSDTA
jgi:hypothetical protein